jgi:hypothetical protein
LATDSATKQYIKQQIASNLNIKDATPQSKIAQMLDGFLNEADNYEDYAEATLDNLYIQTCTESFLEKAGAQEGLARNRLPSFRFNKNTSIISISSENTTPSNVVLKRGKTIQLTDAVWVTLLEDVDLALISSTPTYISCDLDVASLSSTAGLSLAAGSSFPMDNNGYYIKIDTAISLPTLEETLEEFRARVVYSKFISKFGSESAIRLAVASTSFVTDYTIDYSTNPFTIYLFNTAMLYTADFESYIETYAKPVIESQLLHRKSAGANFTLDIPSKVGFTITLKSVKDSPKEVPSIVFSFLDYITKTYKLGEKITYNQDSLIEFLNYNSVDTTFLNDYKVIFNRKFLNFTYASEDNSVSIFEKEYPYLESITLE